MAWKTRKNRKIQRGSGWFNFLKKKTPVSTNETPLLANTNKEVSYQRRSTENQFIDMKKRKAIAAKTIRNHIKKIRNSSNEVRTNAYKLMANNVRNRTRKMVNTANLNAMTNDQIIEMFTTGKTRSLSY